MKTYFLNVNGFETRVSFSKREISLVFDRLLDEISLIHEKRCDGLRTIAFLSGPPGAGKSTLGLALSKRAGERKLPYEVQCLGLDGFHKRSRILQSTDIIYNGRKTALSEIKGAPETFDAVLFKTAVTGAKRNEDVLWPVYDRRLHDVSDEGVCVTGDILIIEGNWLMLAGEWAEARKMCDISISLSAKEDLLKARLIERKMRGGKTDKEAAAWYETVDGPNIKRYIKDSEKSDISLFETEEGIDWI